MKFNSPQYKFWVKVHHILNTLAWKFVPTKNVDDPKNKHILWRLNNWAGNKWIPTWIERTRTK